MNCIITIFITHCINNIDNIYINKLQTELISVRKYILLTTILFYMSTCFAQDTVKNNRETVEQKNRLTETVTESFKVLKADKKTKEGLYSAVYKRKTALAIGKYIDDRRTGTWHFYDINGRLVENFDYDSLNLLYEEPMDSLSQTKIVYSFDNKFTDSDRVTRPLKIGGRCFGFIPYLKVYTLSEDLYGINLYTAVAILEVLVSPGGRLADFKVHIRSNGYEKVTSFSPDLIAEDDKVFVPATLNHKPILSRIFIKCRITGSGDLDVD